MNILVVDDDPHIVRALAITLKGQGYTVVTATDGESALRAAAQRPIAVMILDLGLPDMDGNAVIAALREWSAVPILVLSARHGSNDKVEALDAGADDYITKPFGLEELLARLRALLRRSTEPSEEITRVETSSFTVDLGKRQITKAGQDVRMTPTEWNILDILIRNPDKLITQQQLLTEVWGPGFEDRTNYLRVHISAIRKKLEPVPHAPVHLTTEPGLGYRLEL